MRLTGTRVTLPRYGCHGHREGVVVGHIGPLHVVAAGKWLVYLPMGWLGVAKAGKA